MQPATNKLNTLNLPITINVMVTKVPALGQVRTIPKNILQIAGSGRVIPTVLVKRYRKRSIMGNHNRRLFPFQSIHESGKLGIVRGFILPPIPTFPPKVLINGFSTTKEKVLFPAEIQNRTPLGKETTRSQLPNRSPEQLDLGHGAPERPVIVVSPAGNPDGATLAIPEPTNSGAVIGKKNAEIANLHNNVRTLSAGVCLNGFKSVNTSVGIAGIDNHSISLLHHLTLDNNIRLKK
jgi:hypothetical protein